MYYIKKLDNAILIIVYFVCDRLFKLIFNLSFYNEGVARTVVVSSHTRWIILRWIFRRSDQFLTDHFHFNIINSMKKRRTHIFFAGLRWNHLTEWAFQVKWVHKMGIALVGFSLRMYSTLLVYLVHWGSEVVRNFLFVLVSFCRYSTAKYWFCLEHSLKKFVHISFIQKIFKHLRSNENFPVLDHFYVFYLGRKSRKNPRTRKFTQSFFDEVASQSILEIHDSVFYTCPWVQKVCSSGLVLDFLLNHCEIHPIIDELFTPTTRNWPVKEWWNFCSNSTRCCPLVCGFYSIRCSMNWQKRFENLWI